ncbi:MAG: hypothetical protein U0T69_08240 [Chitinophagales bacterium]
MGKLNLVVLLPSIILMIACCNDNPLPTHENKLKGKLKTFEDEFLTSSISNDSAVRFYFMYDSLNGILKNVSIKIQLNNVDTIVPVFTINKDINGDLYVYMQPFLSNSTFQRFKISATGKRINSVVGLDTVNNTETVVAYAKYSTNIIDSSFDVGYFLNYNIRFSDFVFSNQDCTNYSVNSIVQSISPPYNTYGAHTRMSVNYINDIRKNKLFMQNAMDASGWFGYGLLLYFLSVDDYYMIPPNQHLISDITTTYTEYDDTLITRYSYQYSGSDVTSVKRTFFSLADTSIKTEYYQRMTYY